jgi:hypothetical protein
MRSVENNEIVLFAKSLKKRNSSYHEISMQLLEKGISEKLVMEIIENLKTQHNQQKRSIGFACCGIGVTLLVAGCMLTLFLFNSGSSIKFAMYGLTTIGVVLTIKGLIDIME